MIKVETDRQTDIPGNVTLMPTFAAAAADFTLASALAAALPGLMPAPVLAAGGGADAAAVAGEVGCC